MLSLMWLGRWSTGLQPCVEYRPLTCVIWSRPPCLTQMALHCSYVKSLCAVPWCKKDTVFLDGLRRPHDPTFTCDKLRMKTYKHETGWFCLERLTWVQISLFQRTFLYCVCVFLLYLSSPLACHIFLQSVLMFRGADPLPLPLFPQWGKKPVPSVSQICT